jgi:hypothetical protein
MEFEEIKIEILKDLEKVKLRFLEFENSFKNFLSTEKDISNAQK